ncbi:MAG TPA: PilN domain-containing protein [Arenimonas sp.]|nr:PilN domain-containing protein [Arenimonas sp.]
MAKINLLPWREERRKSLQRHFNGMLGLSLIAGVLLGALVYLYYSGQVTGQIQRNDLLRQEIAAVEVKIKEIEELDKRKESLLSRKRVIEELQGKRFEMVSLFSELAKTIADGAQITTIKQSGADLTIQGRAQSNARVSSYMKNIMASPVINDPDLTVIEARGGDRSLPYEFILNAKVKKPAAETEEIGALPAEGASQ